MAILPRAVKKPYKVAVILLILISKFVWFAWPRFGHGSVIEERYRRDERMEAHRAWIENPSPTTKAAFDEEDSRLYDYMAKRAIVILLVLTVLNGVGIYYVWTYGSRKTA